MNRKWIVAALLSGTLSSPALAQDAAAADDAAARDDSIIVTAALPDIPASLTERLQSDGIMVAPVGPPNGRQTLVRVTPTVDGVARRELFDVRFVPALPGLAREM